MERWSDGVNLGNGYGFIGSKVLKRFDPFGIFVVGKDSLNGKGWSIQLDKSCKKPCCMSWVIGDSNIERLINEAVRRLPKSNSTVVDPKSLDCGACETNIGKDIRQCMMDKLKSGQLNIICHDPDVPPCNDDKSINGFVKRFYGWNLEPYTVHICCQGQSGLSKGQQYKRQYEHTIARAIIHELSHLCGSEDPTSDEDTHLGPVLDKGAMDQHWTWWYWVLRST